jgi:hypothetical protein
MVKKNLLNDIKARPDRFYRLPSDVARDRRFSDPERLEILKAWAGGTGSGRVAEIGHAIADVERRLAPGAQAAQ